MHFFDDSFGQRKPQTPTSGLGGEAWVKHLLGHGFRHPLSIVFDFQHVGALVPSGAKHKHALPVHGIHGIADQVFQHPTEQRLAQRQTALVVAHVNVDFDVLADARPHVQRRLTNHFRRVVQHELCL